MQDFWSLSAALRSSPSEHPMEIMCNKKKWSELLNTTHKHRVEECGWKKVVISSGQDTGLDDTEIRTWEHTDARVLLMLVVGLDGNAILKGNSWGSAQLVDKHRDDPIIYQGLLLLLPLCSLKHCQGPQQWNERDENLGRVQRTKTWKGLYEEI